MNKLYLIIPIIAIVFLSGCVSNTTDGTDAGTSSVKVDLTECWALSDYNLQVKCIAGKAITANDDSVCEVKNAPNHRVECYYYFALSNLDKAGCAKSGLYSSGADSIDFRSVCREHIDKYLAKDCAYISNWTPNYKVAKLDTSFCN